MTKKPEEDRRVWGRLIPLMTFCHEGIPDSLRMYLLYATTADRDGWSRIGMGRLMKLCGWWTGDEAVDGKKASALRVARTSLRKRGLLEVVSKGRTCKVKVLPFPVSAETVAEWDDLGDRLGHRFDATWPRGGGSTKVRDHESVIEDPEPSSKRTSSQSPASYKLIL